MVCRRLFLFRPLFGFWGGDGARFGGDERGWCGFLGDGDGGSSGDGAGGEALTTGNHRAGFERVIGDHLPGHGVFEAILKPEHDVVDAVALGGADRGTVAAPVEIPVAGFGGNGGGECGLGRTCRNLIGAGRQNRDMDLAGKASVGLQRHSLGFQLHCAVRVKAERLDAAIAGLAGGLAVAC